MADESTLNYLASFLPRTALKGATNFASGIESLGALPFQLANQGLSYLTGREPIPGNVTPSDYIPENSYAAKLLKSYGTDVNQPQRLAPFETPEQKRAIYQDPIKPVAEKIFGPKALESKNRTERYIDRSIPVALEAMTFGIPKAASLVGNALGQTATEAGFGPMADLIGTVGGTLGYSAFKAPGRVRAFAEKEATNLYEKSKQIAGNSKVKAPELYKKITDLEAGLPKKVTVELATKAKPELNEITSKFVNGEAKLADLVDAKQTLGKILSGKIKQPQALIDDLYRPLQKEFKDYLHNIPGNPEFSQTFKSADNLYQGVKQSGALQELLSEKANKNLGPALKYLLGGFGIGTSKGALKLATNYPGLAAAGGLGIYGLKKADDTLSLMNRIAKAPAVKNSMKKLGDLLLKEDLPAATHALKNLDKVVRKEGIQQAKLIKERNKNFKLVKRGNEQSLPKHEGFTLVSRGGQRVTQ